MLSVLEIDHNPRAVVGSFLKENETCHFLAYEGKQYVLKYSDEPKKRLYRGGASSNYSLDPASEWLATRIFKSVGIPVQDVFIGRYQEKIVAVCESIVGPQQILAPVYDEKLLSENVSKILESKYPNHGIENFFWEMFVVDALTGNHGRNTTNFGVLLNFDLSFAEIAPVFGNDLSFSKGLNDSFIADLMKDVSGLKELECNLEISFPEEGLTHKSCLINNKNPSCIRAIQKIVPKMDIDRYCTDVDDLQQSNVISKIKAEYFKKSLVWRYEEILKPALERIAA